MLDMAIIGSGPAALTAALYLGRAGFRPVVFEQGAFGGELAQIAELENYPGFSGSGAELYQAMRAQAEAVGAEFRFGTCESVQKLPDGFTLQIDGESVQARSVLAASGSAPRQLDFKIKPPVSYCALCDGVRAQGKCIAVVGGGNSAVQESLYLAPLAESLTLITRSLLRADPVLEQRLRALPGVEILTQTAPTRELLDQYDYVFVCIGRIPATDYLRPLCEQKDHHKLGPVKLEIVQKYPLFDDAGYIYTGGRDKTAHQTEIKGVYAAGDVRSGSVKQVVTAVADGAAAALEIADFLRQSSTPEQAN